MGEMCVTRVLAVRAGHSPACRVLKAADASRVVMIMRRQMPNILRRTLLFAAMPGMAAMEATLLGIGFARLAWSLVETTLTRELHLIPIFPRACLTALCLAHTMFQQQTSMLPAQPRVKIQNTVCKMMFPAQLGIVCAVAQTIITLRITPATKTKQTLRTLFAEWSRSCRISTPLVPCMCL